MGGCVSSLLLLCFATAEMWGSNLYEAIGVCVCVCVLIFSFGPKNSFVKKVGPDKQIEQEEKKMDWTTWRRRKLKS